MRSYYPKSQIKSELYTNGGEFVLKNGGAEYRGLYYEVAGGRYFTGANADSTPTQELVLISGILDVYEDGIIPKKGTNSNNAIEIGGPTQWTFNYIDVNNITDGDNLTVVAQPPQAYYPQPTEEDYIVGEFERYFVKRINSNIYTEISPDDYNLYVFQSNLVQYQLYIPFTIPWDIKGILNDVRTTNENSVKLKEEELQIQGFQSYFKNNYTQYFKFMPGENLYTDGTELMLRSTGEKYIGLYHVHPDKGPMVGAQHVDYPHEYLIPIRKVSQLRSTPSDLRYAVTGSVPGESNPLGGAADDFVGGGGSGGY